MRYRSETIRSGGALGWLVQRFTGGLLVVLVLTHFFIEHFGAGGDLSYETVARRLSSPLWTTLERILLATALWHGGYGFWLVVQDYVKSFTLRMVLLLVLWTVGLGAFVLGWLALISLGRGQL